MNILYISVFFSPDTFWFTRGIFQKITRDIGKDAVAFSEKLPVKKVSFTDLKKKDSWILALKKEKKLTVTIFEQVPLKSKKFPHCWVSRKKKQW